MKHRYPALIVLLVLAACGTPATLPTAGTPASTTTVNGVTTTTAAVAATPGSAGTGLVGYSSSDLLATEALATANKDTQSYNCSAALYSIVSSFTPIIPTPIIVQPTLPAGVTPGLAYKAEEARLIAKAALNAADTIKAGVITPAMRTTFANGCGPLIADVQMDQVRTVADLTSLMSALAKIP